MLALNRLSRRVTTPPQLTRVLIVALIVTCTSALLATPASAFGPEQSGRRSPVDPTTPCHPSSVGDCLLPFPSDHLTTPDATSPTGRRLDVPRSLFRAETLAELPPPLQPEAVLTGTSGASPLGPILFRLPDTAGPAIGPTSHEHVAVVDLETGRRLPIKVEFDRHAATQANEPATILRVWPRDHFEFGHHIAAFLLKSGSELIGAPLPVAPGVTAALDGSDEGGPQHLAAVAAQIGMDLNRVAQMTDFTVRAESEILAPMTQMANTLAGLPHRVRDVHIVGMLPDPPVHAIVKGQILTYDFREGSGLTNPQRQPTETWVNFIAYLPEAAKSGSVPIVIHGHGLGANTHHSLLWAHQINERGAALITIDLPHHGTRIETDGGDVSDISNLVGIPRFAGVTFQGPIDNLALWYAVTEAMATLDLTGPGNAPDGQPDLDTQRISYIGSSLGGFLGVPFVALAPDIDAAYFEITGGGIMQTLLSSVVWDELGLQAAIPTRATGAELSVLIAGMQILLDPGDSANWAHEMARPADQNAPSPLGLQYVVDDPVVPNHASERLARLAELTQTGPVIKQIPDVAYAAQTGAPWVRQSPISLDEDPFAFWRAFWGPLWDQDLWDRVLRVSFHVSTHTPDATAAAEQFLDAAFPGTVDLPRKVHLYEAFGILAASPLVLAAITAKNLGLIGW
ncbi:MAG: hypothetical protein KDB86_03270 [Actinobacteria bacterium]|nr:hypothetical protein [Actinomycetota bacterium]